MTDKTNKILSDEEIFYIPVTSKDDKPSHLNEIARIIRLIQEDTATAQAAVTASQKDAEIAQKQEDYDDVYKTLQQRDNMLEKAEARIKELEEQNEQLRIGELVIVTEQKQKEQIIAETKAPLMAKIKELEVKTGSCRGCDQFFSTQISEAKAEARKEIGEWLETWHENCDDKQSWHKLVTLIAKLQKGETPSK